MPVALSIDLSGFPLFLIRDLPMTALVRKFISTSQGSIMPASPLKFGLRARIPPVFPCSKKCVAPAVAKRCCGRSGKASD